MQRAKHSLKNLMSSPDLLKSDDPLKAFSEGLLNFHNHYCKEMYTIQSGVNIILKKMMMAFHTLLKYL